MPETCVMIGDVVAGKPCGGHVPVSLSTLHWSPDVPCDALVITYGRHITKLWPVDVSTIDRLIADLATLRDTLAKRDA
jgi:hypothetical protein